jgi:hypothetical protein
LISGINDYEFQNRKTVRVIKDLLRIFNFIFNKNQSRYFFVNFEERLTRILYRSIFFIPLYVCWQSAETFHSGTNYSRFCTNSSKLEDNQWWLLGISSLFHTSIMFRRPFILDFKSHAAKRIFKNLFMNINI